MCWALSAHAIHLTFKATREPLPGETSLQAVYWRPCAMFGVDTVHFTSFLLGRHSG